MLKEKFRLYAQKLKSFRYWPAIVIALLILVIAFGAVQASGPDRTFQPPHQGKWQMPSRPWWPMTPVPMINIVTVDKNVNVTIETENMPENEDFTVRMGFIYTRGIDGIVVGEFNSADGESQELTLEIPETLHDQYRIAIRVQTDHLFPYYAFNWFYNNSTIDNNNEEQTNNSDSENMTDDAETSEQVAEANVQSVLAEQEILVEDAVPSFAICEVTQNESVLILTNDFPEEKLFTVKMGIMPNYPQAERDYDGKMKPRNDRSVDRTHGKPPHPIPPMDAPEKGMPIKPSKIWIPYYEAGTFDSGQGGELTQQFDIPSELNGAYRISIMMYSDDTYPYYSYNWFYNNDADSECQAAQ